ncbi:hypothetical protein QJQ45_026493 [Haematococcus lacustris]|nr:hypothetical protein QJQ45_026493 [Haematococcus lacustris]
MLHINSRGQPGAARSSEKQYTKPWRVPWRVAWRVPSSPARLRVHPMKVLRRNHEESRSLAFCRAIQRGGAAKVGQEDASSQDFRSNLPTPNNSQLTSAMRGNPSPTMTSWLRLQPETAYPTFSSHTREPAKGPRGAAKTRGKEVQH